MASVSAARKRVTMGVEVGSRRDERDSTIFLERRNLLWRD